MSPIQEKEMDPINVPYMPIKEFKTSAVLKRISKSSEAEGEGGGPCKGVDRCTGGVREVSSELKLVIEGIRMEKYLNTFADVNMSLEAFLRLDDDDLQEIGITDPTDREMILKNLSIAVDRRDQSVPQSLIHDMKIAQNVLTKVFVLQNYSTYIEQQMRKNKLMDYRISWNETASMYLKEFTQAALIQSTLMKERLFSEKSSDHLIGKTLKASGLTLPKHLKERLNKTRRKKRRMVFVLGSVLAFIIARWYLWK